MNAQQTAYVKAIEPWAKMAASSTGIPAELIAAWWTWETAYGTNNTSKHNNHAGISANSTGKDYVSGRYAGYNTPVNFVNDYVRIITARDWRGYGAIIDAAKKNPKDYAAITKAHNASAWSEADYNVDEIVRRAREIATLYGQTSGVDPSQKKTQATCPACGSRLELGLA